MSFGRQASRGAQPSAARFSISYGTLAGIFLGLALLASFTADLHITALDPWSDLADMAAGFFPPDFTTVALREVVLTVAFAVTGVAVGAAGGRARSRGVSQKRGLPLLAARRR